MSEFDSELFQEKYKIESTRLSHWNYSNSGYYFVTICTKDRIEYFGKIEHGIICLNQYGSIICQEIYKTPLIRKNVIIDEFMVMPNHIHLILEINNTLLNDEPVETQCIVETQGIASLRINTYKNTFGPQKNNLSSIIRGLKSIITKRIHQNGLIDFQWQSRFYDHIIRDEEDSYRIKEYIKNNPLNWCRDRNNRVTNN
jgi:REP-associated tyrosine transposase